MTPEEDKAYPGPNFDLGETMPDQAIYNCPECKGFGEWLHIPTVTNVICPECSGTGIKNETASHSHIHR